MSVFLLFLFPYLFFVDSNTNKLLKTQQGFNNPAYPEKMHKLCWVSGAKLESWNLCGSHAFLANSLEMKVALSTHGLYATVVPLCAQCHLFPLKARLALRSSGEKVLIQLVTFSLALFPSTSWVQRAFELCLFHVQGQGERLALPLLPLGSGSAPFSPTDGLKRKVLPRLLLLGSDAGAFSIC